MAAPSLIKRLGEGLYTIFYRGGFSSVGGALDCRAEVVARFPGPDHYSGSLYN